MIGWNQQGQAGINKTHVTTSTKASEKSSQRWNRFCWWVALRTSAEKFATENYSHSTGDSTPFLVVLTAGTCGSILLTILPSIYVSFYFHSTDHSTQNLLTIYLHATDDSTSILLKQTYMASSQLQTSAEKFATENYSQVWVSLWRFDPTEPPRTTLNHCHEGGSRPTGKVWRSSRQFDLTEHPSTTGTKGKAGQQGRFKWVWESWNISNLLDHCDKGGNRPTGNVGVSLG